MEAMHLNDRERLVIHEGGVMIGREEVREEWRRKNVEIIKTMHDKGLDIPTISEYMKMTEDEINQLLSE